VNLRPLALPTGLAQIRESCPYYPRRALVPPARRVLVVDDDPDLLEAMHDALTSEGYDSVEASDGEAALGYLRSNPAPGLILLDWNMSPMNGEQFMSELSRDGALVNVPVVLLTADARLEDKVRSNVFAASLRKPIDLEALFTLVGGYCG
jgi:CheY-like chemotaxis protein